MSRILTLFLVIIFLSSVLPIGGGVYADGLTVTRTLPGGDLHPGDVFNVTIQFTAPGNGFLPAFTDVAPSGWVVSVDATWCTPVAAFGNIPTPGTVEYLWLQSGGYASGTVFNVVYRVTVPDDAFAGIYSFPGGNVEYYFSEGGPVYRYHHG